MPHSQLTLLYETENDITNRPAADDINRLLALAPMPAFVADAGDRISAANSAFVELLGYPADSNTRINSVIRQVVSGIEGLNRVVRTANLPSRGDADLRTASGETLQAEIFCNRLPDGSVIVFAADLTERSRAEEIVLDGERKRWQSQRIEALGRLAGGIAHDFNNFLAVLLLQIDILDLQLKEDDPSRERVREIKTISNSVANTVRQLFAFGRKQPMTLAPVELNPVVAEFAEAFRGEAGAVKIDVDLDASLGMSFVDKAQIVNVLRNLAQNAVASMPDGGVLRFSTSNKTLDHATAPDVQPPGQYVEIAVSDTGRGMEAGDEDSIFEPFFATRESDKGAGLALAMVYGIVKQSKGFIWVESKPGEGTTFRVQFPRIDVVSPAETVESRQIADSPGPKTVLLVDDEAAVRNVTAEFLKMSDFEVLQAGTGMEALEIAQSHSGPIHLLLTDFTMPFMDGRQVAEKITKMRPETLVLYMSGNIEQVVLEEFSPSEKVNFIYKPFSSSGLTEKVREVLEVGQS